MHYQRCISPGSEQVEDKKKGAMDYESELRLAQLHHQLPSNEPGAVMHLVEDLSDGNEEDQDTKDCPKRVFAVYYSCIWWCGFLGGRGGVLLRNLIKASPIRFSVQYTAYNVECRKANTFLVEGSSTALLSFC
ncbi:Pescadillo-like [Quillaja saponaria]|uniref:Pescadillo-like n=1 Tax=Quillaja saponaria TaxID=32244 RepID=A0AAD7M750_QUISA|nr:Pescadillo-like [Quillaja saponaria]